MSRSEETETKHVSANNMHDAVGISFHGSSRSSSYRAMGGTTTDISGNYHRLFPSAAPFLPKEADLKLFSDAIVESPTDPVVPPPDIAIPSGYTYLGQFIDHDLTFNPVSLSDALSGAPEGTNDRSPRLDLDSLYGLGPGLQPYLYQSTDKRKLVIGRTDNGRENDLPRSASGIAIIGDPRNDENLIVAQLHLLFLKFHNKLCDLLPTASFDEVRIECVRHYQFIVLHDFLNRVCELDTLTKTLNIGLRHYNLSFGSYIPLEFATAAYRFGHSMVREQYSHNRNFPNASLQQLFIFTGNQGMQILPDSWVIDWRRFFEVGNPLPADVTRNFSRPIDGALTKSLRNLSPVDVSPSLAARNLLRGLAARLPSGQSLYQIAHVSIADQPTQQQLEIGQDGAVAARFGFSTSSPLWWFLLKESEVQLQGRRLGLLGSLIVAETFVGILRSDVRSILNAPLWKPRFLSAGNVFRMPELIAAVGDPNVNG